MLDRQRLTVQAVGQEHGVGQQIRERQARSVAVSTSKNHKCGSQLRTSPGNNDSFEEIGKPPTAPSERAPGPRRDAVEVGYLVNAGKIANLV